MLAEGVAQLSVFALAINEPALAKLVHKFDFELPDGAKREELDMCEVNGITIHQKLPLLVVLILNPD